MFHDYTSPNFDHINLTLRFPQMVESNPTTHLWPHLRKNTNHKWYVDSRFPNVGFLNHDEAMILYNTAKLFRGQSALEIGCWLGWSAAHIAAAGVKLDVIDPIIAETNFRTIIETHLGAGDLLPNVALYGSYSPSMVDILGKQGSRWGLIFIDGDHEGMAPSLDAIACDRYALDNAAILFHDLASPDVAKGLEVLKSRGWCTMIYHTQQIMGVAWRGTALPLLHEPDSNIGVTIPDHLSGFVCSSLSISSHLDSLSSLRESLLSTFLDKHRLLFDIPMEASSYQSNIRRQVDYAVASIWNSQRTTPSGHGAENSAMTDDAATRDKIRQLEAEVAALRASSSWRITRPLRVISTLLKSNIR